VAGREWPAPSGPGTLLDRSLKGIRRRTAWPRSTRPPRRTRSGQAMREMEKLCSGRRSPGGQSFPYRFRLGVLRGRFKQIRRFARYEGHEPGRRSDTVESSELPTNHPRTASRCLAHDVVTESNPKAISLTRCASRDPAVSMQRPKESAPHRSPEELRA
jgi:hypothetical protein